MKRFRQLVIFLLILLTGTIILTYKPPVQIMGEASEALKVYYDVKKADEINSRPITVRRNGEPLELSAQQRPFMTQSMALMVPVETVPLLFYGDVDVLSDGSYRFGYDGHEVVAALGSDGCTVDGVAGNAVDPLIERRGKVYVSIDLLARAFHADFTWSSEENEAAITAKAADPLLVQAPKGAEDGESDPAPEESGDAVSGQAPGETSNDTPASEENAQGASDPAPGETPGGDAAQALPAAYDMRSAGRLSPVRDQGSLGTCWAFASLGALESSLLPELPYVFSVDHMSFMSGYNMTQLDGGDFNMALAYLTSWKGPVLEADDPYGDGVSNDSLESVVHLQEAVNIGPKDYTAIKEAVFCWGGVQSSFYSDMEFATSNSSYYNAKTSAYYYPGKNIANHDIVIVGWDDHYPKENFNVYPENDGAFLCRNSWGAQFGDGGYFYISYEDTNIGMDNLVYTRVDAADSYDAIYQSDLLGWVGTMGYGEPAAWFANVYTATGNEALAAVSFYATGDGSSYDLYVVRDFTDSDSFDTMDYVKSGYIARAGYYTLELADEVPLEMGQRFAVVMRINTPGSERPVAIEYETGEWTSSVDLTDGEGYLSYNGTVWENIESVYQSNACLKAFTNRRENK